MEIIIPFFSVCIVTSLHLATTLSANRKQKEIGTVLLKKSYYRCNQVVWYFFLAGCQSFGGDQNNSEQPASPSYWGGHSRKYITPIPLAFCCICNGVCAVVLWWLIRCVFVFFIHLPTGTILCVWGLEASSSSEGGCGWSGVRTQRGRRERIQEVQQPLPGR